MTEELSAEDVAQFQKHLKRPTPKMAVGRGNSGTPLSPEAAALGRNIMSLLPGPMGVAGTAAQVIEGDISPFEALSDAVLGQVTKPVKAIRNIFAGKEAKTFATTSQTQRWRGKHDGMVRFEIPDSNAKIRYEKFKSVYSLGDSNLIERSNMFGGKLADVLDHPELFKAYPDLANASVRLELTAAAKTRQGSFDPQTNYIRMTANSPEGLRMGILHEIQHWVQRKEGFARGGSPETMQKVREAAQTNPAIRYPNVERTAKDVNFKTKAMEDYPAMMERSPEIFTSDVYDYFHLLGEAEARQIEMRSLRTLEELMKVPGWREPLDVNPEKLIVLSLPKKA